MINLSGPFAPNRMSRSERIPTRYSMAGDDCSLHFDLDTLTAKQQQDHASNQILTAMLQVALLYIADDGDDVCLYSAFKESPWAEALKTYHHFFSILALAPLPLANISYHPMHSFYPSVAQTPTNGKTETLYMISGSNWCLHQSQQLLQMSQNLNSKTHFAEHAPRFGLPVPSTLIAQKSDLLSAEVADFFSQHNTPVMLKTLGLAGARNVTTVATAEEALEHLSEYPPDMALVLQERLNLEHYTEMTVDLLVSNENLEITNVRKLLFANGLWVGNLMGGAVSLTAAHRDQLLNVGEYARQHGFTHPDGYNLGIDYFIRNESAPASLEEVVITEINARWTGGLFPAELVRRLGIEKQPVVAFIDMCPPHDLDAYLAFVSQYLHTQSKAAFSIAPMGFAPFPVEVEGHQQLFVWQIVIGDFDAFKSAKNQHLGEQVLATAPLINASI